MTKQPTPEPPIAVSDAWGRIDNELALIAQDATGISPEATRETDDGQKRHKAMIEAYRLGWGHGYDKAATKRHNAEAVDRTERLLAKFRNNVDEWGQLWGLFWAATETDDLVGSLISDRIAELKARLLAEATKPSLDILDGADDDPATDDERANGRFTAEAFVCDHCGRDVVTRGAACPACGEIAD